MNALRGPCSENMDPFKLAGRRVLHLRSQFEAPKAMLRRERGSMTSGARLRALVFFKSLGCGNKFCFKEPSEVHHIEAALVVSFTRDGMRLDRRLDRREIIGIKVERGGPYILFKPGELTRARNRNDPRFLS
jgi:hypothetical protein